MNSSVKKVLKYGAVFLLGMLAAVAFAPKEVVEKPTKKIEYRTPKSCKRAIELDNEIFTKVGTSMGEFDFNGISRYLDSVREERIRVASECLVS